MLPGVTTIPLLHQHRVNLITDKNFSSRHLFSNLVPSNKNLITLIRPKLQASFLQIFNDISNHVVYLKDENNRLIWKNTKTKTWDYVGALIIPSIPNKPIPRHFDPANINNDI